MRRLDNKNVGGIAINLVEYDNDVDPYGVEANSKPVMLTDEQAEAKEYFDAIPKPGFPSNLGTPLQRPIETPDPTGSDTSGASSEALMSTSLYDPYNPPAFSNTRAWVEDVFRGYMEDVYYPLFFPGNEPKIIQFNGIIQTAAPSGLQPTPNQWTYQWHVAYVYEFPDGETGDWEEILFYKTKRPYYSYQGTPDSIPAAVSMGRMGNLAVGATGFTTLEDGQQSNPDAVFTITVSMFGADVNSPIAYEIELRGSEFYVIQYRPNEHPNVAQVAGPYDSKEEAEAEGMRWLNMFTVDVINEENETGFDEYGEAGQTVEDFSEGVFDGDMGTISGDIPDRPAGTRYSPMAFLGWSDAINDYDPAPFAIISTDAELKGDVASLQGEPLFGAWDEFNVLTFEVSSGFKITLDVDLINFPVEEGTFDTDRDFSFNVILEGGDTFSLDMGTRDLPPQISIIVDGQEKTPYSMTEQRGMVDSSATVRLVSIKALNNLFDYEPPMNVSPDINLEDLVVDFTSDDETPGDKPDPKPSPGTLPGQNFEPSPSGGSNNDDDEDEDSGSLWLGLGLAAGVLLLLLFVSRRGE